MVSITLVCKTDRAKASRDVCGLDRPDLVDDMREHLGGILLQIELYRLAEFVGNLPLERKVTKYFQRMSSSSSPYSAMTKAYLAKKLNFS